LGGRLVGYGTGWIREAGSTSVFLSFSSYTSSSICSSPGAFLFGISKTSFQQRILASLGDIYDGRAFGLDWHRSGRIRLGGLILESIHFFSGNITMAFTSALFQDYNCCTLLRSGNSKEETWAMNHTAISDFFFKSCRTCQLDLKPSDETISSGGNMQ
jgi:hypothetical protein